MFEALTVKPLLKRGALVAAANWQVIVLQFIAESAFKLLLAVPVIGAAFLVALLVGGDVIDLASHDVRQIMPLVLTALADHPGALTCYLLGTIIIGVGGATLTFLAKGGTVTVLLRAERQAPALERPPLRMAAFRRAEAFAVERFSDGSRRLFRQYLVLGCGLMLVYGLVGCAYLIAVYASYRVVAKTGLLVSWTLLATGLSALLVIGITIINLLYLLIQVAVAAERCRVCVAIRHVSAFLRREYAHVAFVFGIMLVVVGLATAASILAMASLGFIGFIPVVGLAVLPLQLAAWLARGLVFQYLGLTALCAYVRLYRGARSDGVPLPAAVPAGVEAS
jgi:hypothetical protein